MSLIEDEKLRICGLGDLFPGFNFAGKEVPRPLSIEICRGDSDISVVLKDILALTS